MFDKREDLQVYLCKPNGRLSRVPIEDVITTVGGRELDSYIFSEQDPGAWEIGVAYGDVEPAKYTITVLSAEEQAYYDNRGSSGVTIIITGP
jgi:hypothetical protein